MYTLELPHRGYSNVYLQHMLLKIRKKTIWKFTFSKYHVNRLYLFLTSQTAIQYLIFCHSTAKCLYLHDSYISKFKFMNFIFANLLVGGCIKFCISCVLSAVIIFIIYCLLEMILFYHNTPFRAESLTLNDVIKL